MRKRFFHWTARVSLTCYDKTHVFQRSSSQTDQLTNLYSRMCTQSCKDHHTSPHLPFTFRWASPLTFVRLVTSRSLRRRARLAAGQIWSGRGLRSSENLAENMISRLSPDFVVRAAKVWIAALFGLRPLCSAFSKSSQPLPIQTVQARQLSARKTCRPRQNDSTRRVALTGL